MVKDVNPGVAGSGPEQFTAFGGAAFFTADDGQHGYGLWKTDGTEAGTVLVKDGVRMNGYPSAVEFGGALYFFDVTGALWKTDGTTT